MRYLVSALLVSSIVLAMAMPAQAQNGNGNGGGKGNSSEQGNGSENGGGGGNGNGGGSGNAGSGGNGNANGQGSQNSGNAGAGGGNASGGGNGPSVGGGNSDQSPQQGIPASGPPGNSVPAGQEIEVLPGNPEQLALEATTSGRATPLETLLPAVRSQTGGDVIDVKLVRAKGILLYEFKVLTPNGQLNLNYYYARSGQPVEVR